MEPSENRIRPAFPMPRIRPPYYRPGNPFVAEFSTYVLAKRPDGSVLELQRLHGSLSRDSLGGTKTALWGYGPASEKIPAVIIVSDPVRRTISTAAGDGSRIVEDPLDPAFHSVWTPSDPLRVLEMPGLKTILGINCRKLAFEPLIPESSPAQINECWISDELALVMEDIQETETSRSVWEIVRFERLRRVP